jgi:hypothetical protein
MAVKFFLDVLLHSRDRQVLREFGDWLQTVIDTNAAVRDPLSLLLLPRNRVPVPVFVLSTVPVPVRVRVLARVLRLPLRLLLYEHAHLGMCLLTATQACRYFGEAISSRALHSYEIYLAAVLLECPAAEARQIFAACAVKALANLRASEEAQAILDVESIQTVRL